MKKTTIVAEFECAWRQIPKAALSKDKELECKSEMSSLAHRYATCKIDRTGFRLREQHLSAIKSLKMRKDVIITRPDKCNGIVVLEKSDYVHKMEKILKD